MVSLLLVCHDLEVSDVPNAPIQSCRQEVQQYHLACPSQTGMLRAQKFLPEVPKTCIHLYKIFIRTISLKRIPLLNFGSLSKVSFIIHTMIFLRGHKSLCFCNQSLQTRKTQNIWVVLQLTFITFSLNKTLNCILSSIVSSHFIIVTIIIIFIIIITVPLTLTICQVTIWCSWGNVFLHSVSASPSFEEKKKHSGL